MGDLSKNFNRQEFTCRGKNCCGGSAPVHPDLVAGLQEFRDKVGLPLDISSGFRCRSHNEKIGGAENSLHTLGMAADISCPDNLTALQMAEIAESIKVFREGGIGIYKSWLHVDVRKANKARWQK